MWYFLLERLVNNSTVSEAYTRILHEAESQKWSVKLRPDFDFKNESKVVKDIPLHLFKVTKSNCFNKAVLFFDFFKILLEFSCLLVES